MELDRISKDDAARSADREDGVVLRASRRGALVLQTANARRMQQRLAKLRPLPPEPPLDAADGSALEQSL